MRRTASGPVSIVRWPAAGLNPGESGRDVLSDDRYDFWQSRYSPDGRMLSFVYVPARGTGYPSVALASADDPKPANWRWLGPHGVWLDKPRWSPDGRMVYYLARDERFRFDVWATRIDATAAPVGRPIRITSFDKPDLTISAEMDRAEMSVSAHRLLLDDTRLRQHLVARAPRDVEPWPRAS